MTDTTPADLAAIDLTRFFERHDHRNRLVSVAAISASLVLSAVIYAHGPADAPSRLATTWGFGMVFTPLVIVAWWTFTELMAHGRRKGRPPAGPLPTSADDVRNGVRVANGGFVFHLGLNGALVAQQAFWALLTFGYPVGDWIPRATCLVVGAVTLYLGNLWPRMPAPRAPDRTAALRMKVNRISGWLMVIVGLLVILLGVFLPLLEHHRP